MSRELTPEQQARIAEILGYSPPTEVYDPNFADAYQRVVDTDPELALAWQESLQEDATDTPKVKLPVENMAGRARRTATLRGLIGKVSSRRVEEEDTPTPTMPDQRKLTVSLFAVLFIVAFAIALGTFIFSPSTTTANNDPTPPTADAPDPDIQPVEVPVVELPPAPSAPEPTPALDEQVIRSGGPSLTPPPGPAVTPPPVVTNASTQLPPGAVELPAPTGGIVYAEPRQAAPLAETTYRPAQPAPESSVVYAATPGTGSVITPNSAQAALMGQNATTVVYQAERTTPQAVFGNRDDLRQNQTLIHASDYRPAQGSTLVFERQQDEAPLGSPRTTSAPPIALDVPAPSLTPRPANATELGQALANAATPAPAAPGSNASTPPPSNAAAAGAATPLPTPQASSSPVTLRKPDGTTFILGERIPAVMVTSATILDGVPAPVIAETRGEWCNRTTCPTYTFIGTARLLGGNRVIINFQRVVTPTGVVDLEAIALSAEYTTSIPATIRDETPTIAPDLVRASLNGVAAYADILSNATRVTMDGSGNRTEETLIPDLPSLIAGNAAKALGLPQSATTVVRLAEIDPGTPVVIAIGLTY